MSMSYLYFRYDEKLIFLAFVVLADLSSTEKESPSSSAFVHFSHSCSCSPY